MQRKGKSEVSGEKQQDSSGHTAGWAGKAHEDSKRAYSMENQLGGQAVEKKDHQCQAQAVKILKDSLYYFIVL